MKVTNTWRTIQLAAVLIPILLASFPGQAFGQPPSETAGDPLGSFQTAGAPALLNWTGDGQRIVNPSFETGSMSPWVAIQSNARVGSSVLLISQAYDGTTAALLTARSGNATSDSSVSLTSDLSASQVAFSASMRLRAAFYVENITGTTSSDRVEVSLTLTNSTGFLRRMHYVFGGNLPANTTSDAYFRILGSTGQWITIDRNVAADALAGFFTSAFTSLDSVQDARLTVYSRTTGLDPKIKYFDTNNNFAWDVGEPVVYDLNGDRYYQPLSDQIIDGPAPGSGLKSDPRLKFLDSNPANGMRDATESVVYDTNNNNMYDIGEPVIAGSNPSASTVLTVDPKIKYQDVNISDSWNQGEPVINDNNDNNTYDLGEPIVDSPYPMAILQDDPKIRFVDYDNNRVFNLGESVIYDADNNGRFDAAEPVIAGAAPPVGTSFSQTSSSRFDRVELYSATGNFEWIRNNGFERGTLAGWGAYGGGFQTSTTRAFAGTYSAVGDVIGGAIDMAQGLDSEPRIESWSRFKASVYTSFMNGTSSQDYVDVWLGLVDSSPNASPAFIHYVLKTAAGVPSNSTNTEYHWINLSSLNQWLSVNKLLQDETAYFSTSLYTLPFHMIVVGVQVSAQVTSRTTAFFDEFSFFGPYHPGPYTPGSAPSYGYAVDGQNSTYVYTAQNIPHGAFYIVVPSGDAVVNVTAPGGTRILQTEYTKTPSASGLRIDIPVSTSFRYAPLGDWKFYTTSLNGIITTYTEDTVLGTPSNSFNPSALANFVSRSRDPLGNSIVGASATLTLWNTSPSIVETRTGTTGLNGWFNATSVILPSTRGEYRLQATVNSTYIGVKTFQLFIGPRPPAANFTYTPNSPIVGDVVTFTALVSGGQTPYAFSWNFGDTVTSSCLSGCNNTARHSYSSAGDYTVTLTVTDSNSSTANASHIVTVSLPPRLQADFTFTPASPASDISVSFTATASGGRGPYTFSWNFADQTAGTGSSVTHMFSLKGVYAVGLTVTDANGANVFVTHDVNIHYELNISINTSATQLTAGSPLTITGQVSPAKPGVTVTLSYRLAGDPSWTTLGNSTTDTNGKFAYTWTPQEGDYEVAGSVGDTLTTPAQSNREQVFVSSGSAQLPWLILVGAVISAVAIVALFFLFRRNRKKLQPSPV